MISSALNIIRNKGFYGFLISVYYLLKTNIFRRIFGIRFFKKNIRGSLMYLDSVDKGLSRTLLLFGKREEEHKIILENVLRPGMNVLDIGANIGYYVLMSYRKIGNLGEIIAVEPSPENVNLLKANIELNNCSNIKVFEGAISDHEGTGKLFISEFSNLHSFHKNTNESIDNNSLNSTLNVQLKTVPQMHFKNGPPDIIRMDVEGHEVEIMNGMLEAIENDEMAPMILFETHHNKYTDDHDISLPLRRLFSKGYSARYIGSSSQRGTNIINKLGYIGGPKIKTDFMERVIYENIDNDHLINLICQTGGVRTVLLSQ